MAVQEASAALMHLFVRARIFATLLIEKLANLVSLFVVRVETTFVLFGFSIRVFDFGRNKRSIRRPFWNLWLLGDTRSVTETGRRSVAGCNMLIGIINDWTVAINMIGNFIVSIHDEVARLFNIDFPVIGSIRAFHSDTFAVTVIPRHFSVELARVAGDIDSFPLSLEFNNFVQ